MKGSQIALVLGGLALIGVVYICLDLYQRDMLKLPETKTGR